MPIYCYNLERFLDSIDRFEEENPDRAVAIGHLGGNYGHVITKEENNKRLADFVFPEELFADRETLEDLAGARKEVVVTGIIPSTMLATEHDDVLSYDEYREFVREIASKLEEPVFLTGHFSPGRKYRMYGNADNDKPRNVASMRFPEAMFSANGTTPLKNMALGYLGTIIIEAEELSEDARALARDEIDSVELDRDDDSMEPTEIYDILSELSAGDRVRINDRNRAMTVVPQVETSRIGFANAECLFLSGNGTEYRLELKEDKYGQLDWNSDTEYVRSVEVVERAETEQGKIAA